MQHTYLKKKRFISLAALLVASLIVVAAGTLWWQHRNRPPHPQATQTQQKVDLSPPTAADKQAVNQNKDNLAKQSQQSPPPADNKHKTVTPVIVDASQYGDQVEVRSYVPDIYEQNGTCTIKFTQGDHTVTKQVQGAEDATTTRCPTLDVSHNEFAPKGSWTVTVNYNSPTASGTSQPRNVEVK